MKRLLIFCFMYPLSISTIFGQKAAQSSVFFPEPIDLKFEALSPEQIKERLKKLN